MNCFELQAARVKADPGVVVPIEPLCLSPTQLKSYLSGLLITQMKICRGFRLLLYPYHHTVSGLTPGAS